MSKEHFNFRKKKGKTLRTLSSDLITLPLVEAAFHCGSVLSKQASVETKMILGHNLKESLKTRSSENPVFNMFFWYFLMMEDLYVEVFFIHVGEIQTLILFDDVINSYQSSMLARSCQRFVNA